MTKLNNFRHQLSKILTSSEMSFVKGGNLKSITIDPAINLSKVTETPKIASDDKRRERPGGGITTL